MEDFMALESEGAPSVNFSNSNTARMLDLFDIDADSCGICDPDEILDHADDRLSRADSDSDIYRITELTKVAKAAKALGRQVVWA